MVIALLRSSIASSRVRCHDGKHNRGREEQEEGDDDALIGMDLLPRSEATSRLREWHIEVSTVLKINPSVAELLTHARSQGAYALLALLLCAAMSQLFHL